MFVRFSSFILCYDEGEPDCEIYCKIKDRIAFDVKTFNNTTTSSRFIFALLSKRDNFYETFTAEFLLSL